MKLLVQVAPEAAVDVVWGALEKHEDGLPSYLLQPQICSDHDGDEYLLHDTIGCKLLFDPLMRYSKQ